MSVASGIAPATRRSLVDLADAEIISLSEAVRLSGIRHESLNAAIADKRLHARFGRVTPVRGQGRTGTPVRWIIKVGDLRAFMASLEPCRYDGCDRLGSSPTGCCSGPHAQGVIMHGVSRPEIGAKVSDALTGRRYGSRPPEWRYNIAKGLQRFWASDASRPSRARRSQQARDPHWQCRRVIGRWGSKSAGAVGRATDRLARELRRRLGGAPPKFEMQDRWLAMYEGCDPMLEGADGPWKRRRTIAFLDWQRHPKDWSRTRYPASPSDPESIGRDHIERAADRVRKGIEKALQRRLEKTFFR